MSRTVETFDRNTVVERARLYHMSCCISALYFGDSGGWWTGDKNEGRRVYYNGQGDHYIIV